MLLSGFLLIAATLLAVAVCLRRVHVVERQLELAYRRIDPDVTPRQVRDGRPRN